MTAAGASYPSYEENGNQTRDDLGRSFVYDAWNRLVRIDPAPGAASLGYSYDALGRRVVTVQGSVVTDFYYSKDWQVVEERVEGATTVQYVWSPVHQDAMVLRDRYSNGGQTLSERLWPLQGIDHSVTALVDSAGTVVERYLYLPFGEFVVRNPDWTARPAGTAFGWSYLHHAMRYDMYPLYEGRGRWYDALNRRYIQLDPSNAGRGQGNGYVYSGNNPDQSFLGGAWETLEGTATFLVNLAYAANPIGLVYDGLVHQDLSMWRRIYKPIYQQWQKDYGGFRDNNYTMAGAAFHAAIPIGPGVIGVQINEALWGESCRGADYGRPLTPGERRARVGAAATGLALMFLPNKIAGRIQARRAARAAAASRTGLGNYIPDPVMEHMARGYGQAAEATFARGSSVPVTGSQWYEYFSAKYGADNVQWSRLPEYAGGKVSGVLATRVGDIDLLSGMDGPASSFGAGAIPGRNGAIMWHVEAHAGAAMRQLGLRACARITWSIFPASWSNGIGTCLASP